MFSIFQRGQSVLNFSLTLVGFIAAFVALTSWGQLYGEKAWSLPSVISNVQPAATIKFSRRFGSAKGGAKENNKLVFDLDADLTPLFNWNTKQVFVYLTAEYPGKSEESSNKVTYWDKIITQKDKAHLSLKGERSKYSVWDTEESFRNREATVKLEWNIQPHVGAMVYGSTEGENIIVFPSAPTEEEKDQAKAEKAQQKKKQRAKKQQEKLQKQDE